MTTTTTNDGGMDAAGLAMLVAAVEANVDAASTMHNQIVANEQRVALDHARALITLYDAVVKATKIISVRELDAAVDAVELGVDYARGTVQRLTGKEGEA